MCDHGQRGAKTQTRMARKCQGLHVQLWTGRGPLPEEEARRAALVLLHRQEGRKEEAKAEDGEDDKGDTEGYYR